jgi:hypothetical protein
MRAPAGEEQMHVRSRCRRVARGLPHPCAGRAECDDVANVRSTGEGRIERRTKRQGLCSVNAASVVVTEGVHQGGWHPAHGGSVNPETAA